MNKLKIIIPMFIIIIISVGIIITIPNEEVIEEAIIDQDEGWTYSGPFGIDKKEYNLGEKIFLDIVDLPKEHKGIAVVLRPFNTTHHEKYMTIEFDGSMKNNFNRYFEPRLNEFRGICSTNDLVGEWRILFLGVEYEELKFRINNQTSSWDDRKMQPLFGKGIC